VLSQDPSLQPRFSLIFLHGFCNTAEHYANSEAFELFRLQGLRVVLPTAPRLQISAHSGKRQNAWYNYLTDHDGEREDDIDEMSMQESRLRLNRLIDLEAARVGGHSRVILGGASQGCCAAFDVFARFPQPLAGFVGFVGHPMKTTLLRESLQRDVPCAFYNGGRDETMRLVWVRACIKSLVQAGWTRAHREVAEEADHYTSNELESEWMDKFLEPLFSQDSLR